MRGGGAAVTAATCRGDSSSGGGGGAVTATRGTELQHIMDSHIREFWMKRCAEKDVASADAAVHLSAAVQVVEPQRCA